VALVALTARGTGKVIEPVFLLMAAGLPNVYGLAGIVILVRHAARNRGHPDGPALRWLAIALVASLVPYVVVLV